MGQKLDKATREEIFDSVLETKAIVDDVVSRVWEAIEEKPGFENIAQAEAQSAIGTGLIATHKEQVDDIVSELLDDTEQVRTFDRLLSDFDQRCQKLNHQNLPEQNQVTHAEVDAACDYEARVRGVIEQKKNQMEAAAAAEQKEKKKPKFEKAPRLQKGAQARLAIDMRQTIGPGPVDFIDAVKALYSDHDRKRNICPLHYSALLDEFNDRFSNEIQSGVLPKEGLEAGFVTVVDGLKETMYRGGDSVRTPLGPIGVIEIFKSVDKWPWNEKLFQKNRTLSQKLSELLGIVVDDLRLNRFQYTASGFARIFEGVSRLSHHDLPRDFYPVLTTVFQGVDPFDKASATTVLRSLSGATLQAITPDFLNVLRGKLQSIEFDQELFRATISALRSFNDTPQIRSIAKMLHRKYQGGANRAVTGTQTRLEESFYGLNNFVSPAFKSPEDGLIGDLFAEFLDDKSPVYVWQLGKYFSGFSGLDMDQIPAEVLKKLKGYKRYAEKDLNESCLRSAIEMLQSLCDLKGTVSGYNQDLKDFTTLGFRIIEAMSDKKDIKSDYLDGVMQVYTLHREPVPTSISSRYPRYKSSQQGKSISHIEPARLQEITDAILERYPAITVTQNDRPIDGFECDIVLHLKGQKLVLELDGADHASHVVKDARRDAFLAANSMKILRLGYGDITEPANIVTLVSTLLDGNGSILLGPSKCEQLGISEEQGADWPDLQKVYAGSQS